MALKNSFIDPFCFWPITTLPSLVPPAFTQLWQSLAPAYLIPAFQQRQHKPLWQVSFIHSPTLKRDIFSSLVLSTPLCNRAHSEAAVWKWHLTWHFFCLVAAATPQRIAKSLRHTHSNKAEPLLPVSCWCIIILSARPHHLSCSTALAKQHTTDLLQWQKCSPEPGSARLTPHCASWTIHTHRQLLESTCQLSQLSPQDLQEPSLHSAAMEANSLKELSVNTGTSTENHNFLIATHIPHLELIFAHLLCS